MSVFRRRLCIGLYLASVFIARETGKHYISENEVSMSAEIVRLGSSNKELQDKIAATEAGVRHLRISEACVEGMTGHVAMNTGEVGQLLFTSKWEGGRCVWRKQNNVDTQR